MSKDKIKLISAYVQQEDYFIGTMTVGEVMMFHVRMFYLLSCLMLAVIC